MGNNKILVDSCVWIALYDENDRQHGKAVKLSKEVLNGQFNILLHSLVLIETLSILKYKKFEAKILKQIRQQIRESENIELIKNYEINLSVKMWQLFEKKNKLGLVDIVLLDYCLKNNVELVTFDKELEKVWKELSS